MLWVGTARGLNWFEKGDFKHFSPADGLTRAAIGRVSIWPGWKTLDQYGSVAALSLLSKGKTVVFNTSTGLADDFGLPLAEDAVGNV